MPGNNLKLADKFAPSYDHSVLKNNWNGSEILFNAVHHFLPIQSKILDLGIGTGESAVRFSSAGHLITGIDGSVKMLAECKKKNIAQKLIHHDLENPPFPCKKGTFNAVISNGVFHLIYPLHLLFSDVKRILIPDGYFAFTYDNTDETIDYKEIEPGIWKSITESGVFIFKYSDEYIATLLYQNKFNIVSQNRFLAYTNPELQKSFYFTLIVANLI